jgi:Na+/H+-translocating membrane pyrophosphatase
MELPLIFVDSILGLLIAIYFIINVLKRDAAVPKMHNTSNAIKESAEAFLKRQRNKIIACLRIILTAFMYIVYAFLGTQKPTLLLSQAIGSLGKPLSVVTPSD